MKAISSRFLSTLLTTFFIAAAAHAGTLSGTVINRTTGKPEPNVDLDLLSPTQGMVELATAKSDAQGRFSVTKDNIGMAPILVRATFHDVSFNTFAPPGRPEVEVEIFDISKDPKTISVPSHVVIFQPENGKLIGAEEYTVQNTSQPPHAYFRTEGNFDFAIPENGTLGQVTTTATMGMAVTQASIDKGKGRFSIAFAFRPGQTNVRLSYELPYTNNSAALKLPATYPGAKLLVVVPPGVTLTGDGLTSAGQEQGMMVYTHDPLPAKGVLSVSLSGAGSPQAASGGQDQGATQEGNSRQGPEVMAAPSRLDDFKWYLFAGIAALFAMGAILLTRKQVVVAAVDADEDVAPPSTKSAKPAPPAKAKKAPPAPAPAPPPVPPANVAAEVHQQVGLSMDSLKDQIFRLELRRQAGTISEEDYAREKARFDKLLRDLVKG
jgi:5-hydroxyisourate hydrolase-like protein (transthyretin family)